MRCLVAVGDSTCSPVIVVNHQCTERFIDADKRDRIIPGSRAGLSTGYGAIDLSLKQRQRITGNAFSNGMLWAAMYQCNLGPPALHSVMVSAIASPYWEMTADSLFFENGSGACVRVVDREKWSVRALRRIDPRTRLFFLDVLGYIAADETPLSATDVPPSFSRTRQSYPRQPSRVLRTMERRPADPAVDSICAPVSQPW